MPATCPTGALTSFPIGHNISPITQAVYDALKDSIAIDMNIQWASHTTAPQFIKTNSSGGTIDIGSTNQTTMRYNSIAYTLFSAQLCKATHTPWVLPITSQAINKVDLVLTFRTLSDTATNQIIVLVIPILSSGTSKTDPSFLSGVADPTATGAFSLKDCLPPKDSMYLHYVTCLTGYSSSSDYLNTAVYVNTVGLPVSSALIESIKTAGGFATAFPVIQAPFMTELDAPTIVGTGRYSIGNFIHTTTNFLINEVSPTQVRAETAAAATAALSKGSADKSPPKPKDEKVIDPGKLERTIGIVLGVIIGILFVGLGGYYVYSYMYPSVTPGPSLFNSSVYTSVSLVAVGAIGGYLAGTLLV